MNENATTDNLEQGFLPATLRRQGVIRGVKVRNKSLGKETAFGSDTGSWRKSENHLPGCARHEEHKYPKEG